MLIQQPEQTTNRTVAGYGFALLLVVMLVLAFLHREDELAPQARVVGGISGQSSTPAPAPEPSAPDPMPTGPQSPFIDRIGTLQANQTLSAALAPHGVSPGQVNQIVEALAGKYSFRSARAGAQYSLRLRRSDGRLERFHFEHGALEIYEVARDSEDRLSGRRLTVATQMKVIEVGAEIRTTLYQAMNAAGESPGLVALVTDVFAYDIDFLKQTRPGDAFRVIVEKIYKEGTFIRYGRILAAEYTGHAGLFHVFYFKSEDGKQDGYFLADGRSARKTFLATPLKFARVSSRFNKRRKHPILGYTKAHNGVDYAAPTGTPVWAMAAGTVTFAREKGASGNLVVIRHDNGLTSLYAHLHRIHRGIKRGVKVKQKQLIGQVGTTGRSTGPHLHFAVKRRGKYINPHRMKMSRNKPMPKSYRHSFDSLAAQLTERLAKIPLRAAGPVAP